MMQTDDVGMASGLAEDADWDLDLTIVESGPVVDELMRLTDDGCGTTCESACGYSCP